jgi:hypothetical protein
MQEFDYEAKSRQCLILSFLHIVSVHGLTIAIVLDAVLWSHSLVLE